MNIYQPATYEVQSIDICRDDARSEGWLYAVVKVLETPAGVSPFLAQEPRDPRRQLRTFTVTLSNESPNKAKEKVHRELYSRGIVVDRKKLPTPVSYVQR